MKTEQVTTNLITETMPPSVAKPAVLRWRSSHSGRIVMAHLESLYNRDTARDSVRAMLEAKIEDVTP